MNSILLLGIVVVVGFLAGEIAEKIKLPKVTGYILAGVILNPRFATFIPKNFVDNTGDVTSIALALIVFSIGGSLYYPALKKKGKSVLLITLFEAEFAFLAIFLGFLAVLPFLVHIPNAAPFSVFIPLALLLGSLGSPTDPSATLAVKAEYKPRGEVSETILNVAAFDDVTGIINYSVAVVLAGAFILGQKFSVLTTFAHPLFIIAGSVVLGVIFGFLLNFITLFIRRETEGVLIMVLFGLMTCCFGLASIMKADELLSVMTMGAVVANFNAKKDKIFKVLERYIDELVFVVFFTLSGMHLDIAVLMKTGWIVLFFVIFRTIGKFSGAVTGAVIAGSSRNVRKYTAGGLIPQGGIVIGLALMLKQYPAFDSISDVIINVVIGTAVIHEFVGPICTKAALRMAKEI